MKLGYETNAYGTTVTKYRCDHCGMEFTVCPVPEDDADWQSCLALDCPSYDSRRDADKLFDRGRVVKERIQ